MTQKEGCSFPGNRLRAKLSCVTLAGGRASKGSRGTFHLRTEIERGLQKSVRMGIESTHFDAGSLGFESLLSSF